MNPRIMRIHEGLQTIGLHFALFERQAGQATGKMPTQGPDNQAGSAFEIGITRKTRAVEIEDLAALLG